MGSFTASSGIEAATAAATMVSAHVVLTAGAAAAAANSGHTRQLSHIPVIFLLILRGLTTTSCTCKTHATPFLASAFEATSKP